MDYQKLASAQLKTFNDRLTDVCNCLYRAPIAIGAWTTIVMIGFDPFMQQLVNYRTMLIFQDNPEAKVALAQRWSGGTETLVGLLSKSACIAIPT